MLSEWTAETAEWYAENYGEYATNRLGIAQLDLAADATLLDIGCGAGPALRHAAAKVTAGTLIGVDPVPRMVEIARERLVDHAAAARISLHVAPAQNLPVADHSIDVALAFDSYDHWGSNQRQGLTEVRRVLATGGRFAVVKDGSVPYSASARQTFLAAVAEAGFSVLETHELSDGDVTCSMWIFGL